MALLRALKEQVCGCTNMDIHHRRVDFRALYRYCDCDSVDRPRASMLRAGVPAIANGMATGADWMSAAGFISMAGIISLAALRCPIFIGLDRRLRSAGIAFSALFA